MKQSKITTNENLLKQIEDSISAKKSLENYSKEIQSSIKLISKSLSNNGKVLLCGNGGSAADAQHLAAEFLVRLRPNINRQPLAALTLATDISTLTACGNDYSFNDIFVRPLKAIGNKKDILIVISTSGNSQNIINVLKQAKKMGMKTIGFLGKNGGKVKKLCNIPIVVKSNITARIQESHIFLGHYIFEKVENNLIKKIKI
jgi:D-sedoheptulose 7-phosphate isomerase